MDIFCGNIGWWLKKRIWLKKSIWLNETKSAKCG